MSESRRRLTKIEDRLSNVKSIVGAIKATVTDQNKQLSEQDSRLGALEAA